MTDEHLLAGNVLKAYKPPSLKNFKNGTDYDLGKLLSFGFYASPLSFSLPPTSFPFYPL